MPNNAQYTWENENIVEDIETRSEDAEAFLSLLQQPKGGTAEEGLVASPGTILKGTIVEITKDHVVVDVGLKSEGMVPIEEFTDPTQLVLDGTTEVFLDAAEDSNGQIVLSREKAERQRQWEHIVENCEEGSIVKGRITRKVKGGLMVDIGMEAFLPG